MSLNLSLFNTEYKRGFTGHIYKLCQHLIAIFFALQRNRPFNITTLDPTICVLHIFNSPRTSHFFKSHPIVDYQTVPAAKPQKQFRYNGSPYGASSRINAAPQSLAA